MVFSLKGVVKLRKLCNFAVSWASADKPSMAAERGEQEGQFAPGPQGLRGLIIEGF